MSSRSGSGERTTMSDLSLNQQVIAEFQVNGAGSADISKAH